MLNVIWSESAIEDYSNNIDYLEKKWTKKVIADFIEKADTTSKKSLLKASDLKL